MPQSVSKSELSKSTADPESESHKKKSATKSKSKSKSSSSSSKSSSKSGSKSGTSSSVSSNGSSNPKSSGGKAMNMKSYEASNVIGRPKLCKQMAKVICTKGAIKLKSTKELNSRGYSEKGKALDGQESVRHVKGPKDKSMILKTIHIKKCTPRYKITMEKYSVKIMRFIGKKPLIDVFPKYYDIFLIDKCYYIYMGECGHKSLYQLVTGKHDIPPAKTRKWVRQLTEGVKELQNYGIAHRFIRLKYLMLDKQDHLKIVGWSKSVLFWDSKKKKALYQHREHRARRNNFLPPESFHRLYDPSKADVWAIGVILVTLTTRRYPFHVRAMVKFSTQWLGFVKKHPMNPIIRALCNKIFVIDTKKRIHARDMLAHSYFKVDDKQLVNRSVRGKPLHSEKPKSKGSSVSVSKSNISYVSSKGKSASASHPISIVKSNKSSTMPSTATASASQSQGSQSQSGYNKSSTTSSSDKPSCTSQVSKSTVGASQTGNTSKSATTSTSSSSKGSKTTSSKKIKSSKTKSAISKSAKKPKSVTQKSLKSKSAKPKSAAPKSAPKTKSKSKSSILKESSKGDLSKGPKSASASKANSKDLKELSKSSKSKGNEEGLSKIDGVSKQEMEAETDDAQAEADQAAEEATEPEMDEVAKESGAEAGDTAGDGEVGPEGADEEGVADEQEMQAPEEAADQATPDEVEPEEGEQLLVEEAATNEMAGVGEEAGGEEGADGADGNVDGAEGEPPGEDAEGFEVPADGAVEAEEGAEIPPKG